MSADRNSAVPPHSNLPAAEPVVVAESAIGDEFVLLLDNDTAVTLSDTAADEYRANGLSRRNLLKAIGAGVAVVGVASVVAPPAAFAASGDSVFDLYTEVGSYEAAHPSGTVASNTSGQFAYYGLDTNGAPSSLTGLPGTAMTYSATTATNGKWTGGGATVGPDVSTPFAGVQTIAGGTNNGGQHGKAAVVRFTTPTAPIGSYTGTGTITVKATLTAGTDAYIFVTDSAGTNLVTPVHLTTGGPTTNFTVNLTGVAATKVYYVAVVPGSNTGDATVDLDVTVSLHHS